MTDQTIAKGYTQTEVGVIPEGWKLVKLESVATLTSSKRIYLSEYKKLGIPFYRGKEISELKNNQKIKNILYISSAKYKSIKQAYGVPKKDDILITAVGTLGNIFRVRNNDKFYFKDGNLIWLKFIKINSTFFEYILTYNKNKLLKSSIGSTQKALTIIALNKVNFILPKSKPEQQKIADILTTWDEAIEKQTALIQQKQQLKKGLMQQLLTGKTRFSEFNDDWIVKELSILCKIKKGQQLNKSDLIEYGKYPAINGGINSSGYTNNYNISKNTITISEGGNSCGYINYITTKFWSGGHCYSLLNLKVNDYFLYQSLKLNELSIMRLRVGSGLPNIQKGDIENIKINLPPAKEQQKIAQVITLADDEITQLQNELALLKTQKKGLMQQLLTGKIRVKFN